MGRRQMLGRSEARRRVGVLCAAVAALGTVALVTVASGQSPSRPTISGDPIVGHTLTSSLGPTGLTLYLWEGCDPAVADCSDSLEHNDPNWTDLAGPSHTGRTYTVADTDFGHFIRVLIHDNNLGNQWVTSMPVGPVTRDPEPPPPPPPPPLPGAAARPARATAAATPSASGAAAHPRPRDHRPGRAGRRQPQGQATRPGEFHRSH